jgi:hypothetical protein
MTKQTSPPPGHLVIRILLMLAIISSLQCSADREVAELTRARRAARRLHFHQHISRKVLDYACAASKDTVDEIMACTTKNEYLSGSSKLASVKNCYTETYGTPFDPNDAAKHKELICKNRDKFELLTACFYQRLVDEMTIKELERFGASLVDLGLCIVNALGA